MAEVVARNAADAMEAMDRTAIEQMHRARQGIRSAAGRVSSGGLLGGVERLSRDGSRPGPGRRARAAQDDAPIDPRGGRIGTKRRKKMGKSELTGVRVAVIAADGFEQVDVMRPHKAP